MNTEIERQREKQDEVEDEIKRLAEQLLAQVGKVNEIAHLLVKRIDAS